MFRGQSDADTNTYSQSDTDANTDANAQSDADTNPEWGVTE